MSIPVRSSTPTTAPPRSLAVEPVVVHVYAWKLQSRFQCARATHEGARRHSCRSGPRGAELRHVSLGQRGKVAQGVHHVSRLDVTRFRSPHLVFVRNSSENEQRANAAVVPERNIRELVVYVTVSVQERRKTRCDSESNKIVKTYLQP